MKHTSIRFASAVSFLALCQTLAAFPVITNGSLTGQISNGGVPAGWSTLAGSPDTMDQSNNVGGGTPFGIAPSGPSPDGGTWVGFANGAGGFKEIFGQNVSGFSVGTSYTLSWFAGNFGALTGPGYTASNSISVSLNGVYEGSGSVLSLGSNWSSESLTFVAAATNLQVSFGLTIQNTNSYLSIDGIRLTQSGGPGVPDGASTATLLAMASLMLAGVARRLSLS